MKQGKQNKYYLIGVMLLLIAVAVQYSFIYRAIDNMSTTIITEDGGSLKIKTPQNHLRRSDFQVYEGSVKINHKNLQVLSITDTGSMNPTMSGGHHIITFVPERVSQINEGDIVCFKRGVSKVCHRVIHMGVDSEGTYLKTKGDSARADPEKHRIEDITNLVIGIIY